ncbi:FmdB family zinc ribbon protein [Streptomyces sp. NPDC001933]|uniref:FmdB family zinc ribbon protein n=1 Tax=Streptomyces sp. NPDC001933 TaxID=3364626 RepID=UPI0036A64A21
MPTYQYQCTECGEGLEAVQKFTDDALTVCPSCDGRLKKVFSAVGIVFKGSGFYRNDSRGSSSSSTPSSSSAKASGSASSSDSSSSASSTPASTGSDSKSSASSSTASASSSSKSGTSAA